ncbi:MAG: (Fe-S)-binding protein [Candidatus Atabeyarchaeum deiterrae]
MEKIRGLAKRIEEEGSRTTPLSIRKFLIGSGLSAPLDKKNTEILMITGCYVPYSSIEGFISLVKLLKHFGVDFTFLEKEYCCSEPLLQKAKTKEEKDAATKLAENFVNRNTAATKKLGAKRVASVCLGCASMMKQYSDPNFGLELLYYPNLLLELNPKMEYHGKEKVGYFVPCMRHHLAYAPKAKEIDLMSASSLLNSVEGLNYVTFEGMCCVDNPYEAIREFKDKGVQRVVTQCFGCQAYLQGNSIGLGGPQIITLPEFMMESLVR